VVCKPVQGALYWSNNKRRLEALGAFCNEKVTESRMSLLIPPSWVCLSPTQRVIVIPGSGQGLPVVIAQAEARFDAGRGVLSFVPSLEAWSSPSIPRLSARSASRLWPMDGDNCARPPPKLTMARRPYSRQVGGAVGSAVSVGMAVSFRLIQRRRPARGPRVLERLVKHRWRGG
jgi:hypothetical protein